MAAKSSIFNPLKLMNRSAVFFHSLLFVLQMWMNVLLIHVRTVLLVKTYSTSMCVSADQVSPVHYVRQVSIVHVERHIGMCINDQDARKADPYTQGHCSPQMKFPRNVQWDVVCCPWCHVYKESQGELSMQKRVHAKVCVLLLKSFMSEF